MDAATHEAFQTWFDRIERGKVTRRTLAILLELFCKLLSCAGDPALSRDQRAGFRDAAFRARRLHRIALAARQANRRRASRPRPRTAPRTAAPRTRAAPRRRRNQTTTLTARSARAGPSNGGDGDPESGSDSDDVRRAALLPSDLFDDAPQPRAPDLLVLARLAKTKAWCAMTPFAQSCVVRLLQHPDGLTPNVVDRIDQIIVENLLKRGRNPENFGFTTLWLGGEIKPRILLGKNRWGLWRIFDDDTSDEKIALWHVRGNA